MKIIVIMLLFFPGIVSAQMYTCAQYLQMYNEAQVCMGNNPTPTPVTAVFPDTPIFEEVTDMGTGSYKGTAAIIFPARWNGIIAKVVLAGEQALMGDPYKGQPVFRFKKVGSAYVRPLMFTITAGATTYTYTIAASTPSGNKSETISTITYGNGDRGHARFSKTGATYGSNIQIFFDGVYSGKTVPNGAARKEWSDGTLWKPIADNSPNKLVILGPYHKKFKTCTIKW